MKLNLTVKTTKNYQTIELSATDIEVGKYPELKRWLINEAKNAINELVPGENVTQTQITNYTPVQQPKGASVSQKQVNFLRSLGYQGDINNMSVTEAANLIDELKKSKNKG